MNSEWVILITVPNTEEASRIAETLVSEHLAACVNIIPGIESVYRWEGKVVKDREVLLLVKSTDERYAQLENRVKELHSYSTPEIIAIPIERGSDAYLEWLRQAASHVE